MRSIILAIVSAIVLAGAAAGILDQSYQKPAYQAFATEGARVGDPGGNLVGKDWSVGKDASGTKH